MSKNDPVPIADLSSDCDYLACGVAFGGEAWAGQRLPIFISGQRPQPGGKAAGLKPSLAKNCRRWAKVSRIKADSCDCYNGCDDL
jgi:hypothetical protein